MGTYSWLGLEGILMNHVDFTGVTAQVNPNQLLIIVRFQHLMITCCSLAGLDIDIFLKKFCSLDKRFWLNPIFLVFTF